MPGSGLDWQPFSTTLLKLNEMLSTVFPENFVYSSLVVWDVRHPPPPTLRLTFVGTAVIWFVPRPGHFSRAHANVAPRGSDSVNHEVWPEPLYIDGALGAPMCVAEGRGMFVWAGAVDAACLLEPRSGTRLRELGFRLQPAPGLVAEPVRDTCWWVQYQDWGSCVAARTIVRHGRVGSPGAGPATRLRTLAAT